MALKSLKDILFRIWRALQRRVTLKLARFLDAYLPLIDPPKWTYHNETGNDRWIVESVFPGLRNGYFVEAGAASGIEGSSCYILEAELGWTGTCIEPHPEFFSSLEKNRPNSRTFNVCLGPTAGEADFVLGAEGSSRYLSGVRSELEQHKYGARDTILATGHSVVLSMRPLAAVLDEVGAPSVIDYLAMDIEGSELAVLSSFPFERYRFRALTLECDEDVHLTLSVILKKHGYREVKNRYNRSRPWERYWLSD